ncbi:MAG: polysaccharide deacetylase family protein [Patescibacteria group bacterium]|jgi:peptidoglycan/xylan/chitin deacetylase (PgdA/CDA1 family)
MKKVLAVLSVLALTIAVLPLRPSAAVAAGVNLVLNPSFETGTTSPTSWSKVNGSSRNRATFTYPATPAFDGAKAARITVTTYKSGDIGWASANFPVTAGLQYDLSVSSKSGVSSTVLAVYKRAGGVSSTVSLGTVSGTNAWKTFTKVVTIPAGVTSMSLRQVLRRTGTLDVDAYSFSLHVTTPTTPNLIANGDLESLTPGTPSQPLSWTTGYWGTLTPVFTYPVAGKTGNGAKVQVTSYTSGDAKWVFNPVATSGGKTYTIAFDYAANVATNVSIEFHMTDGSYTYAWLGDPAASAAWTTFNSQFTSPAGSDSFTVFQSLVSVGTLTIDNYVAMDITSGALNFANGMITLDFDDTILDHYTVARPILNAAGIKASFFAITDPSVGIGSDGYMTWTQVQQLQADGHEIGAHTRTHADLASLTLAQAQAEIVGSKADLAARGITATSFVYPYGVHNAAIRQMVQDAGFTSARSVSDGYNFPGSNKFALLDKHVESTTTLADVQGWINQAKANKTWLMLELHEQTNTPGPDTGVYYNTPAMLQNIVNAITASGIQVVTQAQGRALMNP